METIAIWNHKCYDKSLITDFFGFVAWLVGSENFTLTVNGRDFKVTLSHDGWAASAVTSNYDGHGDHLNLAHAKTAAEALEDLTEKLSEAIIEERI